MKPFPNVSKPRISLKMLVMYIFHSCLASVKFIKQASVSTDSCLTQLINLII